MFKHALQWLADFRNVIMIAIAPTKRYVAGKEKTIMAKAFDLLRLKFRDRNLLPYYYAIGLNIEGSKVNDIIGRKEFFELKNKSEKIMKEKAGSDKIDYTVTSKDKFYASSFLAANNIPCVLNLALISGSRIINKNGQISKLETAFPILPFPVIIKNTVLEYNEGFYHCDFKGGKYSVNGRQIELNAILKMFGKGNWVIQEVIKSHEEISAINNSALNTTRIVTLFDGREPIYLTGYQAFAVGKEITDSWGKGAVYVGIDPAGNCLKKYGYFHPNVGRLSRVESHPDSNVRFAGYKISELARAVDICLLAHRYFYYHFVIGWDVAITDQGPMILEANEKPGINAVQCLDGGLRKRIKGYAKKIVENGSAD